MSQDSDEMRPSIVFGLAFSSFILRSSSMRTAPCVCNKDAARGLIRRPRFCRLRSSRSHFAFRRSSASPRTLISRRPLAFSTSKSALAAQLSRDSAFGDAVNDCAVLPFCQQLFVYTKRRASPAAPVRCGARSVLLRNETEGAHLLSISAALLRR